MLPESRISKIIIFPHSNINYELVHVLTEEISVIISPITIAEHHNRNLLFQLLITCK